MRQLLDPNSQNASYIVLHVAPGLFRYQVDVFQYILESTKLKHECRPGSKDSCYFRRFSRNRTFFRTGHFINNFACMHGQLPRIENESYQSDRILAYPWAEMF